MKFVIVAILGVLCEADDWVSISERGEANQEWLPQKKDWEGLKTISCIKSTRIYKEKTTIEFRYYISSLSKNSPKISEAIRGHWSIENKLHWQLDVSYNEDKCKVRKDNGAENFSVLRRATLNFLNSQLFGHYAKTFLFSVISVRDVLCYKSF